MSNIITFVKKWYTTDFLFWGLSCPIGRHICLHLKPFFYSFMLSWFTNVQGISLFKDIVTTLVNTSLSFSNSFLLILCSFYLQNLTIYSPVWELIFPIGWNIFCYFELNGFWHNKRNLEYSSWTLSFFYKVSLLSTRTNNRQLIVWTYTCKYP